MNIKKVKRPKKSTTPKMIRFPTELVTWLQERADQQGIRSEAELVRQVMHEYRQRIEGSAA